MRGVGITEALQRLPDVLAPVFALLTQLGDVWFVFLVLVLLYAAGERLPVLGAPRRRVAFVLGLVLGGIALTTALKAIFGFPRPPAPASVPGVRYVPGLLRGAYVEAATATGYGFPSGHALLSTVFWGGLASALTVGSRRARAAVAGCVVAVICLARLVLGVHYAVDVVVGVTIGLAYLGVVLGLAGGRTRAAFRIAAIPAVVCVLAGPVTFDDVLILGGALGALGAWEVLGSQVPSRLPSVAILGLAVGIAVLGGLFGVVYVLEPPLVVTGVAAAAVFGGLLSLPVLAERVTPSPR